MGKEFKISKSAEYYRSPHIRDARIAPTVANLAGILSRSIVEEILKSGTIVETGAPYKVTVTIERKDS